MIRCIFLLTLANIAIWVDGYSQSDSTHRFDISVRVASGINVYNHEDVASYEYDPQIGVAYSIQGLVDYNFKHFALGSGLKIGQRAGRTSLVAKDRGADVTIKEDIFGELPFLVSYNIRNSSHESVLIIKTGLLFGLGLIKYDAQQIYGNTSSSPTFSEGPLTPSTYSSWLLGIDKEARLPKGKKIVIGIEYTSQYYSNDNRKLVMTINNQQPIKFNFLSHMISLSCGFKF